MSVNVEEMERVIRTHVAPYLVVDGVQLVNPEAVVKKTIEDYMNKRQEFKEKIEKAKRRIAEATRDLQTAEQELKWLETEPIKWVKKAGEENAIMLINSLIALANRQKKAFENGASSILRKTLKD